MKCRVNQQVVDCAHIYFRETNFGEPAPEVPQTWYEIAITLEEFLSSLEEAYTELADDDREFGSGLGDDAEFRALRDAGWPPLASLATDEPELLVRFVKGWLLLDLLEELFPPSGGKREIRFVINTVDKLEINQQVVTLCGWVLLHLDLDNVE